VPPRRHRAAVDARAGSRGDGRPAFALREAADVVRLVAYARASARGEAFERLSEGQWPSASVVTAVCGKRRDPPRAMDSGRVPGGVLGARCVFFRVLRVS
jgi:hypothetical protein